MKYFAATTRGYGLDDFDPHLGRKKSIVIFATLCGLTALTGEQRENDPLNSVMVPLKRQCVLATMAFSPNSGMDGGLLQAEDLRRTFHYFQHQRSQDFYLLVSIGVALN